MKSGSTMLYQSECNEEYFDTFDDIEVSLRTK